jgi:hypothetical protein
MSSFPCLVRLVSGSVQVRYRLGERLVDRYLEFVAVRAVVNDAQPTARPQDPHRLRPPVGFPDVADRQAADHRVERRRRKGKVTRVRVGKLHPVAHGLGHCITLRGTARLLPLWSRQLPYVRSHSTAGGKPSDRKHQNRAAAASDIQDVLVTAQAQLVQRLCPDRPLAPPSGVQETRR